MSKKRKKRKGRLRVDRIIMVLMIFGIIITSLKLIPYITYNNKIYNALPDAKNNTVEINKKYSKLKLYNKTIDYIKEHKLNLKINYKNAYVILPSTSVKKNMSLKIYKSNKKLTYKNYNNDKSFIIENSGIVSSSNKLSIKLPNYLIKKGFVDIYAVRKNGKIEKIKLGEKTDKEKITIDINKKYIRYFVAYISVTEIKIDDFSVNVGDKLSFNIEYVPKNATVKEYEYNKIGDIFVKENNDIIAKKEGVSKIVLKHKIQNLKKSITVKVNKKVIEKVKDKTIEDVKSNIEVKNGLTYVNGILIVNKTYSVPNDYNPGTLTTETKNAFDEMQKAAEKDNIKLWITSGFRSYSLQTSLYNNYVLKDGKEKADTYSARPGHSEHQTGLAMDLNIVDSSFEGTKEAIWIADNCYKYGFIIRYPKGKEEITGYKYEPWHVRYLGKELSEKVYKSGKTLEEYLNITSKYSE